MAPLFSPPESEMQPEIIPPDGISASPGGSAHAIGLSPTGLIIIVDIISVIFVLSALYSIVKYYKYRQRQRHLSSRSPLSSASARVDGAHTRSSSYHLRPASLVGIYSASNHSMLPLSSMCSPALSALSATSSRSLLQYTASDLEHSRDSHTMGLRALDTRFESDLLVVPSCDAGKKTEPTGKEEHHQAKIDTPAEASSQGNVEPPPVPPKDRRVVKVKAYYRRPVMNHQSLQIDRDSDLVREEQTLATSYSAGSLVIRQRTSVLIHGRSRSEV